MANEHNIKTFTAADIEKYHKGQLSAKERHDLEKAALDDPFLADALEGYAVAGVNVSADIDELRKRLSERTEETKIIPISTGGGRSSFPWARVAAIIILIAGAGLLTYQFVFNNRSKNIAQAETKQSEEIKSPDSNNTATAPANTEDKAVPSIEDQPKQINPVKEKNKPVTITNQSVGSATMKKDTATTSYSFSTKDIAAETPAPAKNQDEKSAQGSAVNDKAQKKDLAKESKSDLADKKEQVINGNVQRDQSNQSQNQNFSRSNGLVTNNRQAENQTRNNIFRGRIMDANNNPVPFANITNTKDEVGTYSNAKGDFNFISPDTVLNVEVRSVGFENNISQLRNNVSNNQVVMQDDRRSLAEAVVISKKPNAAARSRNSTMKIEEPEPADGWDNYDIYLANNLNVPDELKTKRGTGDVEISLEVDKNGNPTNIKVEKSLCEKCDQEAIRLIKEGPRWNRRVRKGRAVVNIPF